MVAFRFDFDFLTDIQNPFATHNAVGSAQLRPRGVQPISRRRPSKPAGLSLQGSEWPFRGGRRAFPGWLRAAGCS